MSFSIRKLTDKTQIKAVVEPHWDYICDDTPLNKEEYQPDVSESSIWLGAYDGDKLAGVFNVTRVTFICWSFHVNFNKEYWGDPRVVEAGKEALAWAFENAQNCRKIVAALPSYHHGAAKYAKKIGLKQEGVSKKSFLKDGELYDLINFGRYQ